MSYLGTVIDVSTLHENPYGQTMDQLTDILMSAHYKIVYRILPFLDKKNRVYVMCSLPDEHIVFQLFFGDKPREIMAQVLRPCRRWWPSFLGITRVEKSTRWSLISPW